MIIAPPESGRLIMLREMSRAIKILAKDLGVPVIALSRTALGAYTAPAAAMVIVEGAGTGVTVAAGASGRGVSSTQK